MFKSREEFRAAGEALLELVEAQARGEVSEWKLLCEWSTFMREGAEFIKRLEKEMKLN